MAKLTKNNCLTSINPKLCKEWDYDKNYPLTPNDFTSNSTFKAWWKCKNCHKSSKSQIRHRNNGWYKCFCYKSLMVINPLLAKEWHPTKNGKLTPRHVRCNDSKKVWWKCGNCGNEYRCSISGRRSMNNRTPRCKKCHLPPKKDNSLSYINPVLAKEWNYNKNKGLTPNSLHAHSNKTVWWLCPKCKNEWKAKISARMNRQYSCFRCRSLANVNPSLAKEWNYKRNGKLTPYHVTFSSGKKVWWVCPKCGYEWQSLISNRNLGQDCPRHNGFILKDGSYCGSMVESYYYLQYKKSGIAFFHNKQYIGNFGDRRYDFYFPSINKYVEVTSYGKNNWPCWYKKTWKQYLDNIKKKEKYVKSVLGGDFEFIQRILTPNEKQFVRKNVKTMR